MKRYNITVNGKECLVEIEEIGVGENTDRPSAPSVATIPKLSKIDTSIPQSVQAQASVNTGAEVISSPMPGTILDIKVNLNQMVQSGELLCILEAMKMENEIIAPKAGKITRISVTKGQSVNTNEPLIVLE